PHARFHLLPRLVAGHCPERAHERLFVDQLPELLRAAAGKRVLDVHRSAQAYDLFGRVTALDALPAGILRPVLFQSCRFEIVVHHRSHHQRGQTELAFSTRAGTWSGSPYPKKSRTATRFAKSTHVCAGISLHGPVKIVRPVRRAWLAIDVPGPRPARLLVGSSRVC